MGNNIWYLFIFIIVVLLAYMWYSGDSEEDKPPMQNLAPAQLPPPGPVYQEVGDMGESEEVALVEGNN